MYSCCTKKETDAFFHSHKNCIIKNIRAKFLSELISSIAANDQKTLLKIYEQEKKAPSFL